MPKVNFQTPYFPLEWGKVKPVAGMFGVSDSLMYELISKGLVESFLLRDKPEAKMGVRLVRIESVRRYFDTKAAEYAKEAKESKGPSPVAQRGREVAAANRARRAKEKETAAAS